MVDASIKTSSDDTKLRSPGDGPDILVLSPHLDKAVVRHGFQGTGKVAWLTSSDLCQ